MPRIEVLRHVFRGHGFIRRQGVADDVRHIESVEVAGTEVSVNRCEIDVIGIAIIGMLPGERRNRRVGSLPR